MELYVVVAVMLLCLSAGTMGSRFRLGSRQEILRLFDLFSSDSHAEAFFRALSPKK
jgi:hypothetical protein